MLKSKQLKSEDKSSNYELVCEKKIQAHESAIQDILCLSNNIVITYSNNKIKAWEGLNELGQTSKCIQSQTVDRKNKCIKLFELPNSDCVGILDYTDNRNTGLYTVCVKLWNYKTGKLVSEIDIAERLTSVMAKSINGKLIGADASTIKLINVHTGLCDKFDTTFLYNISSVEVYSNNLVFNSDTKIYIVNPDTGKKSKELDTGFYIRSFLFTSEGLVTINDAPSDREKGYCGGATSSCKIMVWDIDTNECLSVSSSIYSKDIRSWCISPTGLIAYSSYSSGVVSGEEPYSDENGMHYMSWSGSYSSGANLKLLDLKTGECLNWFQIVQDYNSCIFMSDSTFLIGDNQGVLYIKSFPQKLLANTDTQSLLEEQQKLIEQNNQLKKQVSQYAVQINNLTGRTNQLEKQVALLESKNKELSDKNTRFIEINDYFKRKNQEITNKLTNTIPISYFNQAKNFPVIHAAARGYLARKNIHDFKSEMQAIETKTQEIIQRLSQAKMYSEVAIFAGAIDAAIEKRDLLNARQIIQEAEQKLPKSNIVLKQV